MRLIGLVLGALIAKVTVVYSQEKKPIEVSYVDYKGSGVIVSAQNNSFCPYTVVINFDLLNMEPSAKLPVRKVLVPAKKKTILVRLTPIPGQQYNYKYEYKYFIGNVEDTKPNTDFAYTLPFEEGKEYRVVQGNNGQFSHANKQAVDFSMPENSVVCAARAGVVVEVKQDSNTGCPDASCKDLGNYIVIYHEDGSFATYYHFRQNGSKVQPGQQVAQGEPIGYSGSTGWSSGPHLHFEVDVPGEVEKTTIPVKFTSGGQMLSDLQQGTSYKR